jgi:hypothetical protein
MRLLQALILQAFLGAVGLFAVQDTQPLTVRFLHWGVISPVALLVVVVYVLGMLSGWTVVAFVTRWLRRVLERPTD